MRYQYVCCGMFLFFLTDIAYSESTTVKTNLAKPTHKSRFKHSTSTKSALSTQNQNSPSNNSSPKSKDQPPESIRYYLNQFDKKNLYLNASALYAFMGDGGLNDTAFAQIISPTGESNNYVPSVSPNWGYQVQLGYKLTPQNSHNITATYRSIGVSGTTTENTGVGGTLYNDWTQLGALFGEQTGFHKMTGPATAIGKLSFNFHNLILATRRPSPDDGGTSIQFFKNISLQYMHYNKNFHGQYNGLVEDDLSGTTPGQDNVDYTANYYGIGPLLVFEGFMPLTQKIKILGGGSGGVLAGFYTSDFNESATALSNVPISPEQNLSSYTDYETHPRQAWTPAVFEIHLSVLMNLLRHPSPGTELNLEGGLFVETILPLSTSDSINQNLGQQLDKLNNSLNLSGLFLNLNAQLD